jgi:endonuclease YncB( thermonuclease family)
MKFILAALLFVHTVAVGAEVTHDYKITRIIDGDTVEFAAPFLPQPLKPVLSIRVLGVDTPEKGHRAKCEQERVRGEAASKFTADTVRNATSVRISITRWDKFGGRVLGDVFIDGKRLSQMLILNNYARPYHGEKKTSWCN